MRERQKNSETIEKLTHEYNSPAMPDGGILSMNWVGILITILILLAGAGTNRLVTKSWDKWNIYIIAVTVLNKTGQPVGSCGCPSSGKVSSAKRPGTIFCYSIYRDYCKSS